MVTVVPRPRSGIFGESTNDEAYKVLPGEDRLVKDVMTDELVAIKAEVTVKEARRMIRDHDVLILVVYQEDEVVLAVTEYDLAMMAISEEFTDATTLHELIGKRSGIRCQEDAILADAMEAMLDHRVRHAPVINARGELVGALSFGDAIGAVSPSAASHWLTTMRRKRVEVPEFM